MMRWRKDVQMFPTDASNVKYRAPLQHVYNEAESHSHDLSDLFKMHDKQGVGWRIIKAMRFDSPDSMWQVDGTAPRFTK